MSGNSASAAISSVSFPRSSSSSRRITNSRKPPNRLPPAHHFYWEHFLYTAYVHQRGAESHSAHEDDCPLQYYLLEQAARLRAARLKQRACRRLEGSQQASRPAQASLHGHWYVSAPCGAAMPSAPETTAEWWHLASAAKASRDPCTTSRSVELTPNSSVESTTRICDSARPQTPVKVLP